MPPSPSHLLALAARLPWWAALLSAAAAYALLHPIARLRLPAGEAEAGLAAGAFAQLLIAVAGVAQLLIPLALLLVAAVSAYAAWRRYDLFTSAADDLAGGVLRGLSREECGLLLAEAFRRLGYGIIGPSDPGSGGSGRLVVTRNGRRFLVDFSHWKAWQVQTGLIETLDEATARAAADGALAVSSGGFDADAGRLARDRGIEIADGRRVRELIRTGWDPFAGQALPGEPVDGLGGIAAEADADAKTAAGEALAALIRAEERDHVGIDPSPPPSIRATEPVTAEALLKPDGAPSPMTGWGAPSIGPAATRPPRPRLRLSRMVDGLGMLFAGALLWAGWQWLAALPAAPETSPWHGVPVSPAPTAERASSATAAGVGAARPLGEFHFGPPAPGATAETAAELPPEPAAALMPKLSVWELEAAFNASYIPPPECANWQSSVDMARCGNHRMRTLRAFIAGGGKLLPAMRGESLASTSLPDPDRRPPSAAPSWRDEGGIADPGWADDERLEPIPAGPLAVPYRGPESDPGWRQQEPSARPFDDRPPPAPSWREEQARRDAGDWERAEDRLFVTPEDAEPYPGDWRGDWMRR